ncbi:MAG: proteasome accessory factor PafA2 family protein [Candidatus Methanospirareceae archaeon]
MQRRGTETKIRGVEQEYPVSAKGHLNPSLLANTAIQGLKWRQISHEVAWDLGMETSQELHEARIRSSFADNGSRIYNDMGHLEIATPSYNNPFDAVAYDKASEIYAVIGSQEASIALQERVMVHKNNVANSFGTLEAGARGGKRRTITTRTYATHGNVITTRAACTDWSRVERALIPWIVTRIVFTGGGDVVSGKFTGAGGVKFVISPRALFVTQQSSLSTTTSRGILNTRDQPHAAHHYWRLHDIHYEALRSEYALFLRDIMQALVIRAFEQGFLIGAPELEDPVSTFKQLALDTKSCEWRITLKNGERTDAVAILQFYLDAVERLQESEEHGPSRWDELGLSCFAELLADLEARRLEKYVDGIDWVTKLALLVNYEPRTAAEGIGICNQYALLDESSRYYLEGGKRGMKSNVLFNPCDSLAFVEHAVPGVDWTALPDRVSYAVAHAPEQTRDFFKTALLKRYGSQVRRMSWSTIELTAGRVLLDEPFMLNAEEIGDTLAEEAAALPAILATAKRLYPEKVTL